MTTADISTLWKIAPGSVYRMASEQGWRRRGHQGRTYYHEGDVLRTLDARRRPGPAD
ncbi:helix-turn-helix domain-containing protein [Streptomyces cyaneofuscatus]|nr:helix-turn-helix domain-containing protein [Streptomyces cyaneofuscatus]